VFVDYLGPKYLRDSIVYLNQKITFWRKKMLNKYGNMILALIRSISLSVRVREFPRNLGIDRNESRNFEFM
jgi:hypothetical protein